MVKHLACLAGVTWVLVGLVGAFGQKPADPVEVHVAEKLIPRQQPRPDDWPMHGYDAANTSCNRHERSLVPPLEKVWEREFPDHTDGIVVSSGIVLVTAGSGKDRKHKVFALDARDGRHLWTFTLPGGGGGSMGMTPACSGDLAFFGGQNDKSVYAVNLRTGKLRWQRDDVKSMYGAATQVADGVLYVNSTQSGLWAVDAQTGKEKWHDKAPGWQAALAITDGKVLRPGGAYGGPLVAFDGGTGKQLWCELGRCTSFVAAASEDLVFVTYAGENPVEIKEGGALKRYKYDRVAAFTIRGGKKVWESPLKEDAHYGGLALVGEALYVGSRQGSIYRLNARTGQILKTRAFKDGWGRMIATSNALFATGRGGIEALDPETLEKRWATLLPGFQHLAAANGKLYAAAGTRVVAFAPSKGDGKKK
jgi:outer membrane protein assembly factor BamB